MANPYLLTSLGAAAAVSFACLGSASASCVAASYAMVTKGMASHIPIILSGVLGIYGLIVGALLVGKLQINDALGESEGYANLAAGLAVGFPCYVSGMGIAAFLADSMYGGENYGEGPHHTSTPKIYTALLPGSVQVENRLKNPHPVTVKFVMMLTFLEALGLYGLIVALLLIG